MAKLKYKYMEHYKDFDVFIYRIGREWWWTVINSSLNKISNITSPSGYFNLDAALSSAKKFINKKKI